MAWKQLDYQDLQKILSQDEISTLETCSTSLSATCDEVIDLVADTWRGMLIGKSVPVDIREHYIPGSLAYWVLVQARYSLWTRFPNSPAFALDEARKKEYEQSREIFSSGKIGTEDPEWEHSSDNPENGTRIPGSIQIQQLVQVCTAMEATRSSFFPEELEKTAGTTST